jgi:hypothetical protein
MALDIYLPLERINLAPADRNTAKYSPGRAAPAAVTMLTSRERAVFALQAVFGMAACASTILAIFALAGASL